MVREIHCLLRAISLLLLNLAFVHTLPADMVDARAYRLVNMALFVTYSCFLLLPVQATNTGPVRNTVLALVVLGICSQLSLSGDVPGDILLSIAVVLATLSLFLWSLRLLLQSLTANGAMLMPILYTSLLLLAAPVWLGPLVEISQPADWVINAIVAISPLTHFSVAAEYDYLRSDWFYRYSVLGSLPFRYPSLTTIAIVYMMSTVLVLGLERWFRLRPRTSTGSGKIATNHLLKDGNT